MRLLLFLAFLFKFLILFGQKIDHTASFRDVSSDAYLRLTYENDLFAGQDKNYTQGTSFEFVAPALLKNPINPLLLHLKNDTRKAGITLEQITFTPDDYELNAIQFGDRPFAAAILFKSFTISVQEASKRRIASQFNFGIMGPAALGKETQTGIHRLTGSAIPQGWHNQIGNHFVVNYGVDFEKEWVRINNTFALYGNAAAKIGNLYTNASIGFNTRFGIVNDPYKILNSKKLLLYAYVQPLLTFVGYDGTLQGELFGKTSVYTIASRDMTRIVGQVNYGIALQMKNIYFEYSGTHISKEISSLTSASWGGIRIGVRL